MGAMKELFMQYQEEMRGQDEFIDDDFHFQQWCEQKANEDSEYWENVASGSIVPDDMFYEIPTYQPTPEEEEEAFKLFNERKS
jgi:hypothetical protein